MKKMVLIFVCLGVIFISWWSYYSDKIGHEGNLKLYLNGVIDDINYDPKGFPHLTIHGRRYYLTGPYNFKDKLEIGDSLIKDTGTTNYRLIKHISREEIIFRGWDFK